jgi:enoyl-CoA hydratase
MSPVRVELDRAEGRSAVAVVTLEEPERRNAMSAAMVRELGEAFDRLERDDAGVGAVVVTGAPPAFCAGADLSDLGRAASEATAAAPGQAGGPRAIYEGFLRVARCPLPTVAAVNGPAVGAGMNLALACDVRIAGRSARFDSRFLGLGLHPGGGHTFMLERAVGPSVAAAAVLFGEVLDGEAAARVGLALRCVEDAELVEAAVAFAARAARAPIPLARRAKATLGLVPSLAGLSEAVEVELEAQTWSMGQPFFAERLAAFRARRGPAER